MPTYDYQCRACGSVTEVIHSMLEEGPQVCERCGGQLRRILYPAGIIFKGSGFYRTDSRSGSDAGPSGSDATPSASPDAKPATAKSGPSSGEAGSSAPSGSDSTGSASSTGGSSD